MTGSMTVHSLNRLNCDQNTSPIIDEKNRDYRDVSKLFLSNEFQTVF